MANAQKDQNGMNTMTGILSSDGKTVIRIQASPTTHAMNIADGTTGSNLGPTLAKHDENMVPTLSAVSYLDGVTIVPLYVDANGNLLIDSI